jgi:hypothetical protein
MLDVLPPTHWHQWTRTIAAPAAMAAGLILTDQNLKSTVSELMPAFARVTVYIRVRVTSHIPVCIIILRAASSTTRAKVTSVTPQSLAGSRPGGTPSECPPTQQ